MKSPAPNKTKNDKGTDKKLPVGPTSTKKLPVKPDPRPANIPKGGKSVKKEEVKE